MNDQRLEVSEPSAVGLRADRLAQLDEIIGQAIDDGVFPGAVLLVARRGEIVKLEAHGQSVIRPEPRAMTTEAIFDLASLTKVVVTVPLVLALVERAVWTLGDPLQRHVPELDGDGHEDVTLWHLLTHTSGLPPWANLFHEGAGVDELFKGKWPVIGLVAPPGERVVYSDLGFILLGEAVQRATDTPLDELASSTLFEPMNMTDTCYNPLASLAERIAAAEDDPARGGVLIGRVHDENADAMGGVSGHAGLFSTAADLARYAQMLLDEGQGPQGRVLSPASVRSMRSAQTDALNERRGLGWLLQRRDTQQSGDLLSDAAFGHTGFTGTSLWIDPTNELFVVLLTNRVHPERNRGLDEINRVRALVHNVVAGAIDDA